MSPTRPAFVVALAASAAFALATAAADAAFAGKGGKRAPAPVAAPGPSPIELLADDAGARVVQAVGEMSVGLAAPLDVAVTSRKPGGPAASPRSAAAARAIADAVAVRLSAQRAPAQGKVDRLPGGDPVTLRQSGYRLWVDVDVRVDAKAALAVVEVRVHRVGLRWRELLTQPTSRWLRTLAVSRPLDAELRRVLGAPAAGPRKLDRPRRFELDLGAPVLALAAADLDGDGLAELLALTSDEVVLLEAKKSALLPRQRVVLAGDAPVPRPRDPVGTLVAADLDGDGTPELVARSSEHADTLRLAWRAGALVSDGGFASFPVCVFAEPVRVGGVELVPGENVFAGHSFRLAPEQQPEQAAKPMFPERLVGAACTSRPAAEGGDWIAYVEPNGAFTLRHPQGTGYASLPAVGAAFTLADLDGDGVPELAASAHRAPGDGDVLTILGFGERARPDERWKSDPLSGGIVAVTSGDSDGDGAADVIFAVRLLGSTRTDVWIVR